MKAVIQRVKRAKVTVSGEVVGEIADGLLVLLGVGANDNESDADYLLNKIVNLRIFEDAEGKMNLSVIDAGGALLVVSQFTLYADSTRGRRPSFVGAAPPEMAVGLYNYFLAEARKSVGQVESGRFQAMMDVELVNSGPVTIIIESIAK